MNKALQVFCLIIFISNFSFSQDQKIENDTIKFFDENYKPISKSEFENRKWENSLISIKGDSINHRILSIRVKEGTIDHKGILDSLLTSAIHEKIDPSKPIVIIYYAGKDACSSSGSATRKTVSRFYNKMERGINRIKASTIIYVYKEDDGLYDKFDGFKYWVKDPGNTIERLFFNRHYPCTSFVVISEKGEFISYFGEFSKKTVWKATKLLTES